MRCDYCGSHVATAVSCSQCGGPLWRALSTSATSRKDECPECGMLFSDSALLSAHRTMVHADKAHNYLQRFVGTYDGNPLHMYAAYHDQEMFQGQRYSSLNPYQRGPKR